MNTGKVVSIFNQVTVKVSVDYIQTYKKYNKSLSKQKIMMIHNNNMDLKVGDVVEFKQCAPISKNKKHVIINIVGK